MGKISNGLYDATRNINKVARVANDIEDMAQGKFGKMAKRHIKRNIRKKGNKAMNELFKKIGL